MACTLTPDAHAQRRAEVGELLARALRSREAVGDGARLVFDGTVEAELRAWVAAEAECCPFLDMDLRRSGQEMVLDVSGPPEARPIVAELLG